MSTIKIKTIQVPDTTTVNVCDNLYGGFRVPILEYVHHYDLDKDLKIRFKSYSFPINGRLGAVAMGVAGLIDGLVKILSLGFLVSHLEESLLFDIFDL